MTPGALIPVRDGSEAPPCPVCGSQVPSPRARFCGGACRMRAHRLRHAQPDPPAQPQAALPPAWPQVYQCPECDQRYLGTRRCGECNLFCRRLGPGGLCPECEEPILLAELAPHAP